MNRISSHDDDTGRLNLNSTLCSLESAEWILYEIDVAHYLIAKTINNADAKNNGPLGNGPQKHDTWDVEWCRDRCEKAPMVADISVANAARIDERPKTFPGHVQQYSVGRGGGRLLPALTQILTIWFAELLCD